MGLYLQRSCNNVSFTADYGPLQLNQVPIKKIHEQLRYSNKAVNNSNSSVITVPCALILVLNIELVATRSY